MAKDSGPSLGDARALLRRAHDLIELVNDVEHGHGSLRHDVKASFTALREQMVRRELANIPVARLRETTEGRLRLGGLEQAGVATVLQVHQSSAARLQQIPGVGATTATQLVAAARQVAAAIRDGLRVRVDLDPSDSASTSLIVALHRLRNIDAVTDPVRELARRTAGELNGVLPAAASTGSRLRRVLSFGRSRSNAHAALTRVGELVESVGFEHEFSDALTALRNPPEPAAAWNDFERHSPEFYGLLGELVDLGEDNDAAAGFLPAEVIESVSTHSLDDRFRRVSLRGYQAFGARFALSRQRVIIGDEMGLGKTIQAIAVIAHLRATGHERFLVACPASVLINWIREITERSELTAYRLHGIDSAAEQVRWERLGGVGVTTVDSLHLLTVPHDAAIGLLVVDEAHYVKNPQARRSKAVREWTTRVDRVLFLTGTPMENRVEEFKSLVDYLQPGLAPRIDSRHALAGADSFRRAVAPVYLRRNQEDVLTELPQLVHSDDWVEFGRYDFLAYREAVNAGNFMAMRRAAYSPGTPERSAKLKRLMEITRESAENSRKVVVFSYFRDVLDTVYRSFPSAHGPITGNVSPIERQMIVDRFSAVEGHSVLLSQIQAGGVGLNIQAANVVIICEPQVKPTLEGQAIARLQRMGQVRSVQAHRLLVTNSVDERMVELLAAKSRLFDDYARRSEVAENSADAVDISEVELARRVVAAEQERLAREAMEKISENPG
ncbi:MAG: DEAD/DEAH box helicase [Actinobacteria bacterium]|nr:DEAD/DEAH box helicase [Actinomycetota bacterium]